MSVKPGGVYQASIWVYSTSATDTYRFVIRGVDGDFIKSSTGGLTSFTLTANTWTQLTIPDVRWEPTRRSSSGSPTPTMPADNPAVFYVDDAEFNEGMVATTVGCMLLQLYEDAVLDHVADGRLMWENVSGDPGDIYLTIDFNCDVDSNGDPWNRDDVNQTFQPRMSYIQVVDQIVEEGGYEWRVIPADWTLGTYVFQVFNPAGMGAVVDAAIIGGSATLAVRPNSSLRLPPPSWRRAQQLFLSGREPRFSSPVSAGSKVPSSTKTGRPSRRSCRRRRT